MTLRFDSPSQRSAYYANRRRDALIVQLSQDAWSAAAATAREAGAPEPSPLLLGWGRCACCQRDLSCDLLEIDHVDGRDWVIRNVNRWRRAARYWREYKAGVRMRALCRHCNARFGSSRRYTKRRQ